ncbi:MAG: extracellular solute-binding protein [Clostridia bacterium]|nr:extracellular solute-binding protein [Clostridia bacterium]
MKTFKIKKEYFSKPAALALSVCMCLGLGGCTEKRSASAKELKCLSLYMIASDTPYDPDLPIWKEAEKKTGIRLENTVSSAESDGGASFAMMRIGKKLPDIIHSNYMKLKSIAGSGSLLPLDEYIDKYAPNIKKFFKSCPTAKSMATLEDGHIYFIPGTVTDLDKPYTPSTGFFIRKDWLDKLGLSYPENISEFHDVLYAFRTMDPNGNGLTDEVPYFTRNKTLNDLLYLFDTTEKYTIRGSGVIHGAMSDEYRSAMKELSVWYAEGLIDKEIFTRGKAREQLLSNNTGGCTVDWFSSTGKFNDTYAGIVPGLDFEPMLPPKDINGNVKWSETRGILHDKAWGISKDCSKDDIIDAVRYLDFWMSDEGCRLMAYGVEGISYTVGENGKIKWSKEALSFASGLPNYRRSIGFTEIGTIGIMDAEKAGMNDISLKGYEMYENIISGNELLNISFTESEQEIYDEYYTKVSELVYDMQHKWIMGEEDVDSTWDSYITTLHAAGVDNMMEIYNNAYNRYKNISK